MAPKANLSFNNRFPYISVTDEASDFEFGKLLGFAKYHKITPRRKIGGGLGLGELPKFFGPNNISATTGASDFKFGGRLGFAKSHHKIARRRKGGRGPRLGEFPKI